MDVKSLVCLRRATGMAPIPTPPVPRCWRRCRHSPCVQQLQPHHPRDTPFLLKCEQEESEASLQDRAQSCAAHHPPKTCSVPRTSCQGGAAASSRRASEQEHWEGLGCPIAWPPPRRHFCLSILTLLTRKTKKYPQRSCGEGEMPASESTQARRSRLQPTAVVGPWCALHHQLQRGNELHLRSKTSRNVS